MLTQEEVERLRQENARQFEALIYLNDEIMSILHAHSLRQDKVDSEVVTGWLRGLYDAVQEGLEKARHFPP